MRGFCGEGLLWIGRLGVERCVEMVLWVFFLEFVVGFSLVWGGGGWLRNTADSENELIDSRAGRGKGEESLGFSEIFLLDSSDSGDNFQRLYFVLQLRSRVTY